MIILIALAAVVFSIPAEAEMNETQGGGGGTYPPGCNETPMPVATARAVPVSTLEPIIVVPVPEPTGAAIITFVGQTPVVEIRGEVVDALS
jgi:hypothetical protein